ncbi:hypothetical protein [Rhizorhabdus argentea]|uniref:hypothetical protein n=1 Tax=Rhizorhabdus argentea TaxID=1387174 RepID=UPI0030ED4BD4
MTANYSRRCVIAALDVLEARWTHAMFTAFLDEVGPQIYSQVRTETNLRNRMSDLKRLIDQRPDVAIDGESLVSIIVQRAAGLLPTEPTHPWSRPAEPTPAEATFLRTLEMDGFTVSDGTLRRSLPADLGLPAAESELVRLLTKFGLETAKGHLEQAMDAHARANWAGANGQIRTFLDALLDGIAEQIDPTVKSLPTGQPRRAKLASWGFLSVPLNEWGDDGKGFINGLVKRLHPEGPHPGLSDEDDSTFRLHTVLLTTTLLMRRFDRGKT